MRPRRKLGAPAPSSLMSLPRECLDAVVERLPPNCIPLAVRQLNKEMRQHFVDHTIVLAKGDSYLPSWAVLEAMPHLDKRTQGPQLLAALAQRGDVEGMRALAPQLPQGRKCYATYDAALCAAASAGHLDAVRFIVEEQGFDGRYTRAPASAAGSAQLHVLQYLHQRGFDMYNASCPAARSGHIAVLQWLQSNGSSLGSHTLTAAAQGGQLEVMQLVYSALPPSFYSPWYLREALEAAASCGHLAVLQHWHQQNYPISVECGRMAAANGHLHVLRWLKHHGVIMSDVACNAAAGGHREILLWLREEEPQRWTEVVCAAAARAGDAALLQWLREQAPPCPWNHTVIWAAAMSAADGAAECLEYALANGCTWRMCDFRQVQKNPKLRHVHFPGVRRSARGRQGCGSIAIQMPL